MKHIDDIAREFGFDVKRNNENDVDYYLMDSEREGWYKHNKNGERLVVSVMMNPFGGTWSFAVNTVDRYGKVAGMGENPLFKWSEHLTLYVPDKEWILAATNENFKKIMEEILRRFFNN